MALGSGQFSSSKAQKPHLLQGATGGLAPEIKDLRDDIKKDFLANAAIAVEEFTDPPAAGAALIAVLANTQVAAGRVVTLLPLAAAISPPRNITVTNAGTGTPADVPASAVVTGTDINGQPQTETLTIPQTATTAAGVKAFASVTSIVEGVGEGASAQLSYGTGVLIGLGKPLKARAGLAGVVREVAVGAVVTNGVFALPAASPPNGTYSPNSAADGTRDYALYYEYDATLNKDA